MSTTLKHPESAIARSKIEKFTIQQSSGVTMKLRSTFAIMQMVIILLSGMVAAGAVGTVSFPTSNRERRADVACEIAGSRNPGGRP